jgi:hypothetical protein
MGCGPSAHDTRLQTVDDSVHVMLKHDKKRQQQKGEAPKGYVPRAEHPLLKPKPVEATEEDESPGSGGGGSGGGANTATTAGAD